MLPTKHDVSNDLKGADGWKLALRFHEFQSLLQPPDKKSLVRKSELLAIRSILDRAQKVLGSLVRPTVRGSSPLSEVPLDAFQKELDLNESLDQSLVSLSSQNSHAHPEDLWMSYEMNKKRSVVVAVDTSLSMADAKLAWTAVALAVVLLEFWNDPTGIIAFENEPKILKKPNESLPVETFIKRFLKIPARGYTHLESGIRSALQMAQSMKVSSKKPSVVLITDGKFTAGKDPRYLAPSFSQLIVLKVGGEKASLPICQDLAKQGHGLLRQVDHYESLPLAMYEVIKTLLRG